MLGRAWLLILLFVAVMAAIILRLAELQLVQGARLAEAIIDDRQSTEYLPARRGRILDRTGKPIVDNRSVYHLAVVLHQLELSRREQARCPFLTLDARQLERLVADLAVFSGGDSTEIRQILEGEFTACPTVGLRLGEAIDRPDPELLIIDAAALLGRDSGGGLDALISSGLISDDPSHALAAEFLLQRDEEVVLLRTRPDDLQQLARQLGNAFDLPHALVLSSISAFVPRIDLGEDIDLPPWYLLTGEHRAQLEDALAQSFGLAHDRVQEATTDALGAHRRADPLPHTLFAAAAHEEELRQLLPADVPMRRVVVRGAPAAQERIYVLQADSEAQLHEGTGPLSILARRCAAGIRHPADEILRLIDRHGTRRSARSLERQYTVQIAFATPTLQTFCTDLASHLDLRGIAVTPLGIERAITACRRRADRDWAGFSRHDPLVILPDIPRDIAIGLTGQGLAMTDLEPTLATSYQVLEPAFPGLRVVHDSDREYPEDGHASHVTGWLKRLSTVMDRREALGWGLDPEGWTGGGRGMEEVYDELLQGITGRRYRLRVPGGYRELEGGRESRPGADLRTTIDLELQLDAEWSLSHWQELAEGLGIPTPAKVPAARRWGQGRGGMVLMDCRSGAVLASASTPGFALSHLREDYHELIDEELHPEQPLYDNACWPVASPGSTVKPLVGLAAMLEGVYRPGEIIHSPGYLAMWQGRMLGRDHPPVPHDWEMEEALEQSSNSFFGTLAERLGPERLADWYELFGLGRRNTVDLRWQRPGLLARPDNIDRIFRGGRWQKSMTWQMGYGQFQTACASPLQMVSIPACIANGGTILSPYIASHVASQAIAKRLEIPGPILRSLRRGMERVCEQGTARWLRLSGAAAGHRVAAKTGTSEWKGPDGEHRPDNAWLIGYAPADRPEVAFAIFLYAIDTSGGRACSGVAKHVLEKYFEQQARAD